MKKLILFFAFVCLAVPVHAQIIIKQSTATTVNFKLTVIADGTDNTGATVTSITASLVKHSDTSSSSATSITCAASGSSNDCVHVAKGLWNMELTTGNTDTLGRMDLCVAYTGSYTDCTRYEVVPAAYYDLCCVTGPGSLTTITALLPTALSNGFIKASVQEYPSGKSPLRLVKNVATTGDRIHVWATRNGAVTKGSSAVSCKISLDGAASAAISDTPVEVEFTNASYWKFDISQAQTNGVAAEIECIGTQFDTVMFSVEFDQ